MEMPFLSSTTSRPSRTLCGPMNKAIRACSQISWVPKKTIPRKARPITRRNRIPSFLVTVTGFAGWRRGWQRRRAVRKVFFVLLLLGFAARPMRAQSAPEGLWQGFDGEWKHVSSQLIALAEATPEEKFGWRPAPGVRSTSEVYMHIAIANFGLLAFTGPKKPADMKDGMEKSITSKAEVISWLKQSLDAVRQAHLAVTPQDLQRKVHIYDRD